MKSEARRTAFLAVMLFVLNVALNAMLFLPGEAKYRDSIEGGYASMARVVSEHPDPFGWNPYQYFGLPTHMWYMPALPYSSALAIKLLPMLKPEHVYRLCVTTAACLVPVSLFLFAFYFLRRRGWALAASIGFTFLSPAYGLFQAIGADKGISYLPWRMQLLVKYGEGPHTTGLMLLPFALILLWRTATERRRSDLAAAAILMAVIGLTNWIAVTAMAWCVLMLLVTGMGTMAETGFLGRRVLHASALAYLLACFWLTPEFIRITAFNWPVDSFNYHVRSTQLLCLGGLVVAAAAIRLILPRFHASHYLILITLCFAGFFFISAGFYWYGVDTIPESRRYAMEFELFFFLLMAEAVRLAWARTTHHQTFAVGACAGVILTFCLVPAALQVRDYVSRGWIYLRPKPRQETVEFKLAEFVAKRNPQGRVLAMGGTRFRINSWFLVPQVGGSFESGLVNRTAVDLLYQIQTGAQRPPENWGADALGLLRVAGAEYFIVHGPKSEEHWKEMKDPRLIAGFPKPVLESGDDRVFQFPFTGLANLVREDELLTKLPNGQNAAMTREYVAAMDDTSRPRLKTEWKSASRLEITGQIPEGMLVTVRISNDPGWRAEQDGQPLEVRHDPVNFVLLQPHQAAQSRIVLHFSGSTQQYLFSGVSAIAWVWVGAFWWDERKRRKA